MTDPYDSSDLDAILELERSPGYALVLGRINEELERRRLELEQTDTGTGFTRGQVKTLRLVMEIPEILKAEIKASLKE